jgi:rRNA maturation protein Rpf1
LKLNVTTLLLVLKRKVRPTSLTFTMVRDSWKTISFSLISKPG